MKIPGGVLALLTALCLLAGCVSGNARAIDTSANVSGNTYSGDYVEEGHVHDETAGFGMVDIFSRTDLSTNNVPIWTGFDMTNVTVWSGFNMADILSRYKVKAACEVVSGDSAMEDPRNETVEEVRTRDRIAAEAVGFDTTEVPSWSEVKAAREANPNHPKCYRENTHTLFTEVNGVVEYLTPEEAVEKYGSNEDFMREYMFLMTR